MCYLVLRHQFLLYAKVISDLICCETGSGEPQDVSRETWRIRSGESNWDKVTAEVLAG